MHKRTYLYKGKRYIRLRSLGGVLLVLAMLLSACGVDNTPGTLQEPAGVDIENADLESEDAPSPDSTDPEAGTVTDTVTTESAVITDSTEITTDTALTNSQMMTDATNSPTTTEAVTNEAATTADMRTQNWLLAYDLIGHSFINADGEISGDIEDLLVDLRTGQILFAEIEYGGFLDIGDREIFVPLTALRRQTAADNITNDGLFNNPNLVLTFDEQVLEQYPDLEDNSPRLNDPLWYEDISAFWNDIFALEEEAVESNADMTSVDVTSDSIVRASDLLSFSLIDIGAGVGTVQNMLINLESSRAHYLLVGFGAGATDTDPYLLPFAALDIVNVDTTEIVLDANITMEALQFAPQFDRFLFEEQALDDQTISVDADYINTVDTFWEEQGITVQ